MSSFGPAGITTGDDLKFQVSNMHQGGIICMGFVGPNGTNDHQHIKTNIGGSSSIMCKFMFSGYAYGGANIESSTSFYTFGGTTSPYDWRTNNWGSSTAYGIKNVYYSSDNYAVIVVRTHTHYTGGLLWFQSGKTHYQMTAAVLAYTSNNTTTGAY